MPCAWGLGFFSRRTVRTTVPMRLASAPPRPLQRAVQQPAGLGSRLERCASPGINVRSLHCLHEQALPCTRRGKGGARGTPAPPAVATPTRAQRPCRCRRPRRPSPPAAAAAAPAAAALLPRRGGASPPGPPLLPHPQQPGQAPPPRRPARHHWRRCCQPQPARCRRMRAAGAAGARAPQRSRAAPAGEPEDFQRCGAAPGRGRA